MSAAIRAEGLTKRYDRVLAVDSLDFEVAPGATIGLLGGNGAGKTTTISMLLGLLLPSAGRIHVLGHDMARHRYAALARMNFSSPYISLPSKLTVRENLRVYAHLYSVRNAGQRIEELSRQLDLGAFLDRPAGQLSAGQKTRVALAKSLVNRPDVLLLDEPTASLDPDTGDLVRTWLEEYRAESGCAILLASHNMAEVERLCDHVLMLRRGRIVDRGAPADLRHRYHRDTLEEVFLDIARAPEPASEPAPRAGRMIRIWGLIYRHACLYRRSWPRLLELVYWPTLQMCIWGFTTAYLTTRAAPNSPAASALIAGGSLLAGVLLWEVVLRSQMGVAITFLEELYSRNLGHIFVSPLRPWEMLAAQIIVSLLRTLVGVLPAVGLAWVLYAFNLFTLGPLLLLLFFNLLFMGWWIALGVVSLILRHGLGAEVLAWSVTFGIAPLSCVFYPVAVLPPVIRPIALALPSTHVFEGMRAALDGTTRWDQLAAAAGLNLVWAAAACLLFAWQFRRARVRGALLNLGE